MSFKHGTMRTFGAPQSVPNINLDEDKPGRTTERWRRWWIRVLHSDYTAGAGSEALNLATLATTLMASSTGARRCSGTLPTDAIYGYWCADLREVISGGVISAATIILGPAGVDDNGFITSSNVFTGATLGRIRTAAAALWTPQPLAGDPELTLATTGANVSVADT